MNFDYIYIYLAILNLLVFMRNWNYINFINPFVSFYFGYFLFVVLGGFYDGHGHLYTIKYEVKLYVIIALYIILITGLINKYILCAFTKINCNDFTKVPLTKVISPTVNKRLDLTMRIAYIFGILLTLIAFSKMSVIPMLSDNVHYYRVAELHGKGYLFHPSRILIFISLTYFSVLYVSTKRISLLYLIGMSLLAFIILLGYGIRAEALKAIAFPSLIIILTYLKPRLKEGLIILVLALAFFTFNGMLQYFRHYGLTNQIDILALLEFGWSNVGHRFWVQLENLQHIVNSIPQGALNGSTYLNDLGMLIPGPNVTGGVILKEYIGLEFSGGGITPTILGEGYANFGLYIAFIFIFLLVNILNIIYFFIYKIVLENRHKGGITLLVTIFFIFGFSSYGFASTTLMGLIVVNFMPLLAVVTLVVLIYLSLEIFSRKKRLLK